MTQPGTKEFAFCAFIQKHSTFYCKKWLGVCCVKGCYSVGRTVASNLVIVKILQATYLLLTAEQAKMKKKEARNVHFKKIDQMENRYRNLDQAFYKELFPTLSSATFRFLAFGKSNKQNYFSASKNIWPALKKSKIKLKKLSCEQFNIFSPFLPQECSKLA